MQAGRRSSSEFFEFAALGNVAPSQAANAGGGRSRRQYLLLIKDMPVVKPIHQQCMPANPQFTSLNDALSG